MALTDLIRKNSTNLLNCLWPWDFKITSSETKTLAEAWTKVQGLTKEFKHMLKFAQSVIQIFFFLLPPFFLYPPLSSLLFYSSAFSLTPISQIINRAVITRVGCPQRLAKSLLSKSVVDKPWPMGQICSDHSLFL